MWERCGKPEDARGAQLYCFQNSMGDYCILKDVTSFHIKESCTSSRFCSQDCKDALTSTRKQLGCCIPSLFNNTKILGPDDRFNYSLWSSCGVEPVSQKCPPSNIIIHPTPVDPTCTEAVANAHVQSIACRKQYVEDIRSKLLATKGCEDYEYPTEHNCDANARGTYCESIEMDANFTTPFEICTDAITCDPLCVKTLKNIFDTSGCCFIDKFSNSGVNWMSPEFWSKCGLTSPGHCKEYLNNGPSVTPILLL